MKIKEVMKNGRAKLSEKVLTASVTLGAIMAPISAHAASYSNVTADSVTGGFISFIEKVGVWMGIPWTAGSILALVLSVRQEDPEGRNKAILSLVCAIALLGIGTVLSLFGLK